MSAEEGTARGRNLDLDGLRVPFGMRDGRLYAPGEVDRGLACQCLCPACGSSLIANKPKIKRNYFSHHHGEDCPGSYETAVHLMAKQIIVEAGQILLPRHEVRLKLPLIEDEVLKETVCYPERDVPLIKVVSEQSAGRWRPDLTATLKNGAMLYIEILVTHAVEEPKAKDLDNLMEIDLSRLPPEVVSDPAQIKTEVLQGATRYWHRCSLYDALRPVREAWGRLEEARAAAIKKLADDKRLQHDREMAHLSFECHKAEKREEYGAQIERLMSMKDPSALRAREAALEESSKADLELARERLSSECLPGHSLPETVGFKIDGDWIFNSDRRVWQALVYERFIWRKPPGTKNRVFDVVGELGRDIGVWDWMQELVDLKRDNKRKGKQRGAWYANKGVWFLSDAENRAIISPYSVVVTYLELLTYLHYGYLKIEKLGYEFAIEFNNVQCRAALRVEAERNIELRKRLLKAQIEAEYEADQIRALEVEKASQTNWLPPEERYQRNVGRMADLAARNTARAQVCSFCHCPTEDLEATICPECEAGEVQPVELTDSYVRSFPHPLKTMTQIRRRG